MAKKQEVLNSGTYKLTFGGIADGGLATWKREERQKYILRLLPVGYEVDAIYQGGESKSYVEVYYLHGVDGPSSDFRGQDTSKRKMISRSDFRTLVSTLGCKLKLSEAGKPPELLPGFSAPVTVWGEVVMLRESDDGRFPAKNVLRSWQTMESRAQAGSLLASDDSDEPSPGASAALEEDEDPRQTTIPAGTAPAKQTETAVERDLQSQAKGSKAKK
jgi:hypothetical protein